MGYREVAAVRAPEAHGGPASLIRVSVWKKEPTQATRERCEFSGVGLPLSAIIQSVSPLTLGGFTRASPQPWAFSSSAANNAALTAQSMSEANLHKERNKDSHHYALQEAA